MGSNARQTNIVRCGSVQSKALPGQRPSCLRQMLRRLRVPAGTRLIDRTHRLYRAFAEHRTDLPAYVLTVEETLAIRRTATLACRSTGQAMMSVVARATTELGNDGN